MISALELNITGRTNFMSIFTRPRPLIRGSFVGLACAVAIAGTQLGASAAEEISAPLSTVSDALVAVEAAQPSANPAVETPAEAEDPVVLETPSGTLEFETPGEGDGHEQADGLTTVFAGEDDASYVAVQPVETGVRALVVLEDASAPREFDFPVTGDVADLRVEADGSVLALDAEGNPLATAAAPWAVDAEGTSVPTRFEVRGGTLIQAVDHDAGDFAYPITADPVWAVIIAAAGACAVGALLSVPTTALLDVYHGRWSSRAAYIENAVASCLIPAVGGWAWRFLSGSTKRWLVKEVLRFVLWLGPRSRF